MMRVVWYLWLICAAAAQTPDASVQFEVASIKPSPADEHRAGMSGGPGTKDPSLFTCENITLRGLVMTAYNLPNYRFIGPDWMRSKRFDISAKIPEGASKEQFRSMLQNLLIERFKLASHLEKKEMQMYDLVVAKNGHKLKESSPSSDAPATRPPGPPKTDSEGYPILPPGRHQVLLETDDGHVALRFAEETMAQLSTYLSAQLGTPVNDATGLTGKYDFTMRWVVNGRVASEDTGPNLFRAVQEQLGLRLESKKGTIDIFVVDHMEKIPAEN